MSEVLRENNERTSDVLEVDEFVDENVSTDDISDDDQAMILKMINDVETRVIQEEIHKDIEENGMPYPYGGMSIVETLSILLSVCLFTVSLAGALVAVDTLSLLPGLSLATLIFGVPNLASFLWHRKLWKKSAKIYDRYDNLCILRKNLLEKMLDSEIISYEKDLSHYYWQEVHMSKNGSDKIDKYYVKIVEDETTGYESFKVKKY